MEDKKQPIEVGRLAGPFGIRGEVRVVSLCAEPEILFQFPQWFTARGTLLKVKSWRTLKDDFAVRFEGIEDRTAAETLLKEKVYVHREDFPEIEDEETFYGEDLVGMPVVLIQAQQCVGHVVAVVNFGASDLLEVRPLEEQPSEKPQDTFYIPFTYEAVPVIDDEMIKVEDAFVVPILPTKKKEKS